MKNKIVRIGGAAGFWGDSMLGAPQLLQSGGIDYLVFDYLAETTMAILASAREKRSDMGYATDFIDIVMNAVLKDAISKGVRIVSNAGGVNPHGCARALMEIAHTQGITLRIAVIDGDDVTHLIPQAQSEGVRDMFSGEELPPKILSAHAYFGALPIARALDEGAQIVITGRCVDSATTLGVLLHEFGWAPSDYARLAGGSLAGHIVECGCQATGGLHTDWEVVPDWPNIGYPILLCYEDGSFIVTKPAGTGGRILRQAVAEQLLYEIGDPGAYVLPDVICDFRDVRVEQIDDLHVRVSGARGIPPTDHYKITATTVDGFRCVGSLIIIGIDAAAKARRTAEAILERTRRILITRGMGDYTATRIEVIGAETIYGPHSRTRDCREVLMRVVVDHPDREALRIFAREIAPAGTSWSPGTTTPGSGRPSPSPLVKTFSFMLDKRRVQPRVQIDGHRFDVKVPTPGGSIPKPDTSGPILSSRYEVATDVEVPLIRLAWARSGDKGNLSNIGVIARRPEWLSLIWNQVTPEVVQQYFSHLVLGGIERFYLPGIAAINYLLYAALDGGGTASMRMDPLGKGMAQILLDLPVRIPRSVAAQIASRSNSAL